MDIQIQSSIITTYDSKDIQGLFNKQSPDPQSVFYRPVIALQFPNVKSDCACSAAGETLRLESMRARVFPIYQVIARDEPRRNPF